MQNIKNSEIAQEWHEKADENIFAGILVCRNKMVCSGCVLIWLGLEQLAKLVIIISRIENGGIVIDDKGDILEQFDRHARAITQGKHGHENITSGLNGIITLTDREIECIRSTNALFERRYLKYDYALYPLNHLESTKDIRKKMRAYIISKGYRADSVYDRQIDVA